ncbi:hypothetical protein BPAE_0030g00380 [Botrytis paeoniae]|uniref:Uncharacterized protein n=1 Tax=Botrytis paeoniae TaxID=278948 RepID=A0A4Z1FYY9_9HELO|nr:hypothetical protein BPAE_0030g00380 [Botrytis paeoniae]
MVISSGKCAKAEGNSEIAGTGVFEIAEMFVILSSAGAFKKFWISSQGYFEFLADNNSNGAVKKLKTLLHYNISPGII